MSPTAIRLMLTGAMVAAASVVSSVDSIAEEVVLSDVSDWLSELAGCETVPSVVLLCFDVSR